MPAESSAAKVQANSNIQGTNRAQPWKINWPPKNSPVAGESHGVAQGEILELEGSAGGHPHPVQKEQ
jgi:hypothetical protein